MGEEKKQYQFCRKIVRAGIYTGTIDPDGTVIKIEDRNIYVTSDKEEIKFLLADPEIVEYDNGKVPKEEDKKEYSKMTIPELQAELEKRGNPMSGDFKKDEYIAALEELDAQED